MTPMSREIAEFPLSAHFDIVRTALARSKANVRQLRAEQRVATMQQLDQALDSLTRIEAAMPEEGT